ncbi:MAG: glutaredoxin family protein [Deltaproteobacteria bacterium]|nr:glutaredoxin family protein [Deltaproteobacteria bacterium]MBW2086034.1 glutaredoxin family protein [Deltaproteobacteria bacterium]
MPEKIRLYALSTCSHCKSAKKLLNDHGVEYDMVEVDLASGEEQKAILEEVKQCNSALTFPTIVIGEKVIIGFHEDKIKEALGI